MKMKKMISVLAAAALLMTGLSLAETALPTEAPSVVEARSGGLFEWVSDGWNTLVTSVESGWNAVTSSVSTGLNVVTDTVTDGWNALTGTVETEAASVAKSITESEWYRTAEEFIIKNSDAVSDAVVQSWNTIKQGALDIGTVAWEKIEEAYNTILDWFGRNRPEKKEEVREALDQVLLQLRAEYQEKE